MELSGQRFINAPRDKVLRALTDAATLDGCFEEHQAVRRVSDAEFQFGAPVHGPVHVTQPAPDTLLFEARQGRLRVRLTAEAEAMTLMSYVLEADLTDAARAQAEIDQLLTAFQAQVAGPREFGASGAAGVQAAAVNE